MVGPSAGEPPERIRAYLCETLPPGVDVDPDDPCERWLSRWGLSLGDLTRELLADVSRLMGTGDEGQALANATVRRYRRVAHSCIRRAVELGQIPADPWPPPPRGRSRRKVNRSKSAVDVRHLPSPASVVAIIDSLRSHQPGSRTYQAMTAVVFYAGLRPSEVVMLRPRALRLPAEGQAVHAHRRHRRTCPQGRQRGLPTSSRHKSHRSHASQPVASPIRRSPNGYSSAPARSTTTSARCIGTRHQVAARARERRVLIALDYVGTGFGPWVRRRQRQDRREGGLVGEFRVA